MALKNIPAMDLMQVDFKETPNKSERKDEIKYIVLHHTGKGSVENIVKWLLDPQAQASAHYVLGYAGEVFQLANTKKYQTWHAGVSKWNGLTNINRYSIGIEICNMGVLDKHDDGEYYYEQGRDLKKYTGNTKPIPGKIVYPNGTVLEGYNVPYPEVQVEKLIALCKGLVQKYPQIKAEDIITHYEIGQPFGRKNDPFGLDMTYVRDMVFYNK